MEFYKCLGQLTNKQPRIFLQPVIHSYKTEKQRGCTLDPNDLDVAEDFLLQKPKQFFMYTDRVLKQFDFLEVDQPAI
jgi:hypothetical protein